MNFLFENDRPIYIQLVEQLKLFIISGVFSPGTRLPSVRDLAMQSKVNPNTMQKALSELENLQLIYTERTNGKFVTDDDKLIQKYRDDFAKRQVAIYLKEMAKLGITQEKAIQYLQELGKEEIV